MKEWNLGCQPCYLVPLTTDPSHELFIFEFYEVILCIYIKRLAQMAENTIKVHIQILQHREFQEAQDENKNVS